MLSFDLVLCKTFSKNKLREYFQRILFLLSQLSLKMPRAESGILVIVKVNKRCENLLI